MLPAERRQFILNELYKSKAVTVNDLAQQLDVTTMTIRRDLQHLEEGGLVEKSHGGAVLVESSVKMQRTVIENSSISMKNGRWQRLLFP